MLTQPGSDIPARLRAHGRLHDDGALTEAARRAHGRLHDGGEHEHQRLRAGRVLRVQVGEPPMINMICWLLLFSILV